MSMNRRDYERLYLRPRFRHSPAMELGQRVHAALEEFFTAHREEGCSLCRERHPLVQRDRRSKP